MSYEIENKISNTQRLNLINLKEVLSGIKNTHVLNMNDFMPQGQYFTDYECQTPCCMIGHALANNIGNIDRYRNLDQDEEDAYEAYGDLGCSHLNEFNNINFDDYAAATFCSREVQLYIRVDKLKVPLQGGVYGYLFGTQWGDSFDHAIQRINNVLTTNYPQQNITLKKGENYFTFNENNSFS